jgi:uncharacterized protein involved in response to NO
VTARTAASAPPVLQLGFRPFFLAGPAFALVALGLWVANVTGWLMLEGPLDPLTWHAHEMLFGFAGAALAGFVLTAVPNWTGRLPLSGRPLALLWLLWLGGRVVLLVPAAPLALAAALDLAFFAVLLLVVAREVAAGRNWRNLPVVAGLGVFGLADLLVWLEAAGLPLPYGLGQRLGIGLLLVMIGLIGGRIVPSFTRNWLAKRGAERLPVPFSKPDAAVLALTIAAVLAWSGAPFGPATALLLAAAALANAWRLARWRGLATSAEPLVWILHLAYLWVPLGLALAAAAAWDPARVPPSAALHALTAGAITLMVVAVMTRATLGHTGRALEADWATTLLYLLLTASAAARVAASLVPAAFHPLIAAAGVFWIVGFALYLAAYAPKLVRPRKGTG